MTMLYQAIARLLEARENCVKVGNDEWFAKHTSRLNELTHNYMPHGAGIDNGVTIDIAKSNSNKLVFHTSYHHMDDNGIYDGWTDHTITVTPSLANGIDVRISGSNRNDIKDYLYEVFYTVLRIEIKELQNVS